MLARLLIAGAMMVLAGCATSTNSLSLNEVKGLKLESVEVVYAETSNIWWGNAEREYAAQAEKSGAAEAKPKGKLAEPEDSAALHDRLVNSPEAKAYIKAKLTRAITENVASVGSELKGQRPVKIVVTVHGLHIPSAAQRVVIGGNPTLFAITTLKDAKTGAELGKLDRISAAPAGQGLIGVLVDQGFDDLDQRVLAVYREQVRQWLIPAAPDKA